MLKQGIFLIISGLILLVSLYVFSFVSKKQSVKTDSLKVIHISEDISLPDHFKPLKWDLPQIKTSSVPHQPIYKSKQENEETMSVWDYISIGRCTPNPRAPDYLQKQFNKTGSSEKAGGIPNLDCGFIRTRIPFSF